MSEAADPGHHGPSTSALVFLVRHGRTALNAEGWLRGRLDPPLDEVGEAEVADLAKAFEALDLKPRRVLAGPLTRTRQTARAIADRCGLHVEVDDRPVDRDCGRWTGEPADLLRARYGDDLADLPDAEPIQLVVDRARAVLDDQCAALAAGPVVLVAHVVNSLLLTSLGHGRDSRTAHGVVPQRSAAWNALVLAGSGWRVLRVNGDADDLRRAAATGDLGGTR